MENLSLAVVTGGSSGIGSALCSRLLKEGYRVLNADIQPPEEQMSSNYYFKECDVTIPEQVQELSESIQELGEPEVLVLNAGVGIHERLREGDPEKWIKVINVNFSGTLRIIRAVLPFMKKGNVLFISSVSSTRPHTYGGVYAATKSALDTIAETLRQEEMPNIGVTVISPGVVDTPFFNNMVSGGHSVDSIGWEAINPNEIAEAVIYALRQKKGTVVNNITIRPAGQVL